MTVTHLTIPNRIIGRNGIAGQTWLIVVNDQDVTREALRLRVDDTVDVLEAAKAYVDRLLQQGDELSTDLQ